MPNVLGCFILIMGAGLVAVALQGFFRGWLPNGPNGYKRGEGVSRKSNPIGFWLFFSLYFAGGIYGVVYALRLLASQATP